MVSISLGKFGKSNFSKAQNSYQMTISLIMMVIMMCAVSSIITMTKMNESSPSKLEPVSVSDEDDLPENNRSDDIRDDAELGPVPVDAPTDDIEMFSIDSEITMYEQCNSNSKIIASEAMDIGQASSELTLERNSINNTTFRDGTLANEKVRRIEVKNVEILPGSKWTVVEIGNHGEEGETTIVLDLPQSYEGNQLLNIGSECSDSTKSYIKYINLIYIPIKLDVNERFEVEGYRI